MTGPTLCERVVDELITGAAGTVVHLVDLPRNRREARDDVQDRRTGTGGRAPQGRPRRVRYRRAAS